MKVTVADLTQRNAQDPDKPNEDYLIADTAQGVFIVCDGVTRSRVGGAYPNPSPARIASERFAAATHHYLTHVSLNLPDAVAAGNTAVARYNQDTFPTIDYLGNDYAGTVAIVGVIRDAAFHYAHIGDCMGYVWRRDGTFSRFTEPQTRHIDAYRATHPDISTLFIRRDVRNTPAHPLTYGVFTGEASALALVAYGAFPLDDVRRVFLMSDGLMPLFEANAHDAAFLALAPADYIAQMTQYETAHALRSDDKSVIVIDLP